MFDRDEEMNVECYADDCVLIITGKDLIHMRGRMQVAIDKCISWASQHGLRFSPSKTEAMLFTRKRPLSPKTPGGWTLPRKLKIGGVEVKYSSTVKYLGVWLDSKLSFRYNLKEKVLAAKRTLHALSSAMGKFWGISPQMALWAWRAIARPKITFGALVWGHVVETSWAAGLIQSAQRGGFKLMTFFRHSTPTLGLEVITNTWPMDLQIRYLQAASFLRTKGHEKHDDRQMYTSTQCKKGHRQLIEEWIYANVGNGHHITMTGVDDVTRRFMWNKRYWVNRESMEGADKGKPKYDSDVSIYTDGSKDDSGSGGGHSPLQKGGIAGST